MDEAETTPDIEASTHIVSKARTSKAQISRLSNCYVAGIMRTGATPFSGVPPNVFPLSTPVVSPAWNPVIFVLKWHTRSSNPSPLTSSGLQKAKLASSPLRPKVRESGSTRAGTSKKMLPSKRVVERIATGMLPSLFGLILFGEPPGLIRYEPSDRKMRGVQHSSELF